MLRCVSWLTTCGPIKQQSRPKFPAWSISLRPCWQQHPPAWQRNSWQLLLLLLLLLGPAKALACVCLRLKAATGSTVLALEAKQQQ
jgi:hypothetical protein